MTQYFTQELLKLKRNSSFLKRLNVDENIFKSDEETVQDTLAPLLRKRAVDHLRTAQTPAAKSFRGEHVAAGQGPYEDYLKKQAQNGAWGTDLEAVALGESLGCNIVVTSINTQRKDATWPLHFESKDAPTIHIYNDNDYHWTNDPNTWTKGEGNCLYNAVAKALQQQVYDQLAAQTTVSSTPATSLHSFHYNGKQVTSEKKILENQQRIEAAIQTAIQNHQTPAELELQYKIEQERIHNLPESEQQQIKDDYRLALKLAQNIEPSDTQNKLSY
ncbi:MAG: hypothetical protein Q8R24_07480 [Legionellaceae bacterium]|nr:hypothetical protein [Legionellaceae bacterium]